MTATSVSEHKFYLNTSVELFMGWLSRHATELQPESFEVEDGRGGHARINLLMPPFVEPFLEGSKQTETMTVKTTTVEGVYERLDAREPGTGWHTQIGPVITVRATQLSEDRLEVLSWCNQLGCIQYYGRLLFDIRDAYPEPTPKVSRSLRLAEVDQEAQNAKPLPWKLWVRDSAIYRAHTSIPPASSGELADWYKLDPRYVKSRVQKVREHLQLNPESKEQVDRAPLHPKYQAKCNASAGSAAGRRG